MWCSFDNECIGEVEGREDETAGKVGLPAEAVCKKKQIRITSQIRIKRMVSLTFLI
jgi:hypothetical protein